MSDSADKRSVNTDALATLGTIISSREKRDAIHLAVEPARAAHVLRPGESVGFLPDGTVGRVAETVGIVDPFLPTAVMQGEWFWLIVYPRQITSLRHVWTHPAFPEEYVRPYSQAAPRKHTGTPAPDNPAVCSRQDRGCWCQSSLWIEEFARELDMTPSRLMKAAEDFLESGNYTFDNRETYKEYWDKFPDFWHHYGVVTGKSTKDREEVFFTCSC